MTTMHFRRARRWGTALLSVGVVLGSFVPAFAVTSASAQKAEPEPPPDLWVDSLEVTQAVQTPTNSIPLVAGKSTAVRASIGVDAPAPVPGVTGRLHVFVNGTEVTPAGGIVPVKPITTWGSFDRNRDNDTLNFELPAPTAITASSDVDFRVDITPKPKEKNKQNNSGSATNLTALVRRTPLVYFTRIDYVPSGLGPPASGRVAPGTGDAFVRGILPVDDGDPLLYRETTPLAFNLDNGNGILGGNDFYKGTLEQNLLLGQLEKQRQLIVTNDVGATDRTFLFGWIAGNPIEGNGAAWTGSRVAFGNTQDDRYQRTFAHELLHDFGLHHNNPPVPEGLDEVGWDVGARLVGNPPGNGEATRAKPISAPVTGPDFDVMTAGKLTNEAWINTTNYKFLLNHCALVGFCPSFELSPKKKVAVVSGSLDADRGKMVALDPVFRYPWKSAPSGKVRGRFAVELTDTRGVKTTQRFNTLDGDGENEQLDGAFSVMAPVDPKAGIASLRIMDVARGTRLAELERTRAPRIRIVSPKPGAELGDDDRARDDRRRRSSESDPAEVRWVIDDPDTPNGTLRFQAAYSNDKGRSWVPLAVDLPGTKRMMTFDASKLPDSKGKGVLRVFVSDGLNTRFADVHELTT